jgi:hypothetical protein
MSKPSKPWLVARVAELEKTLSLLRAQDELLKKQVEEIPVLKRQAINSEALIIKISEECCPELFELSHVPDVVIERDHILRECLEFFQHGGDDIEKERLVMSVEKALRPRES